MPSTSSFTEINIKNGNCNICRNTGKPSKLHARYSWDRSKFLLRKPKKNNLSLLNHCTVQRWRIAISNGSNLISVTSLTSEIWFISNILQAMENVLQYIRIMTWQGSTSGAAQFSLSVFCFKYEILIYRFSRKFYENCNTANLPSSVNFNFTSPIASAQLPREILMWEWHYWYSV
jgi:hypothetical protein